MTAREPRRWGTTRASEQNGRLLYALGTAAKMDRCGPFAVAICPASRPDHWRAGLAGPRFTFPFPTTTRCWGFCSPKHPLDAAPMVPDLGGAQLLALQRLRADEVRCEPIAAFRASAAKGLAAHPAGQKQEPVNRGFAGRRTPGDTARLGVQALAVRFLDRV